MSAGKPSCLRHCYAMRRWVSQPEHRLYPTPGIQKEDASASAGSSPEAGSSGPGTGKPAGHRQARLLQDQASSLHPQGAPWHLQRPLHAGSAADPRGAGEQTHATLHPDPEPGMLSVASHPSAIWSRISSQPNPGSDPIPSGPPRHLQRALTLEQSLPMPGARNRGLQVPTLPDFDLWPV